MIEELKKLEEFLSQIKSNKSKNISKMIKKAENEQSSQESSAVMKGEDGHEREVKYDRGTGNLVITKSTKTDEANKVVPRLGNIHYEFMADPNNWKDKAEYQKALAEAKRDYDRYLENQQDSGTTQQGDAAVA
jgi:DNA repair ATPase RecN